MWFLKSFLVVAILAVLLFVALFNSGQRVDLYLTSPQFPTFAGVQLPVALLGAFILGLLVWFVASFFQVMAAKSEVAALKKKNRQLTRELTDLRNMPVRDLDPESLEAEPAETGDENR